MTALSTEPQKYLRVIHRTKPSDNVPYAEYISTGAPSQTLGEKGDVYIDTTSQGHALYGKLASGWTMWSGPETEYLPYLSHPTVEGMILWCNPDMGTVGWRVRAKVSKCVGFPSTSLLLENALYKRSQKKKRKEPDFPAISVNPPAKRQSISEATNGQHTFNNTDPHTTYLNQQTIPLALQENITLSQPPLYQGFIPSSTGPSSQVPHISPSWNSSLQQNALNYPIPSPTISTSSSTMSHSSSSGSPIISTHSPSLSASSSTSVPSILPHPSGIGALNTPHSTPPIDGSVAASLNIPISQKSSIIHPLISGHNGNIPSVWQSNMGTSTDFDSLTNATDAANKVLTLIEAEPPKVPELRCITRWAFHNMQQMLLTAQAAEKTIVQLTAENKNLKQIKEEEERARLKAENELKLQRALFAEVCREHRTMVEDSEKLNEEIKKLREYNSQTAILAQFEQSLHSIIQNMQNQEEQCSATLDIHSKEGNTVKGLSSDNLLQMLLLKFKRMNEENRALKENIEREQFRSKVVSDRGIASKLGSRKDKAHGKTPVSYKDMSTMTETSSTSNAQYSSTRTSQSITSYANDCQTNSVFDTISCNANSTQEQQAPYVDDNASRMEEPATSTGIPQLSTSRGVDLADTVNGLTIYEEKMLHSRDSIEVQSTDKSDKVLSTDQLNIIFWQKEGKGLCRICLASQIMEQIELPSTHLDCDSFAVLTEHCIKKHADILETLQSLSLEDLEMSDAPVNI